MCYIDKSDSQPVMHSLELYLHLFSHLEIQRTKRLIQKKYLRLIDKSSRYSYSLLLSTRKRGDFSVLKALKVNHLKDLLDLLHDLCLRKLLELEAKCYVVKDIQMWEQRIPLKDRVDRSLIWWKLADILSIQ